MQILPDLGKDALPSLLQAFIILASLAERFDRLVTQSRHGDQIPVALSNHASGNKACQKSVGIFDERNIRIGDECAWIIEFIHCCIFLEFQIDKVAEAVANAADETARRFAHINLTVCQFIQKDIQNVLEDIFAFHGRAYPPPVVIGARQCRREQGNKERGKIAVNAALPVKKNQFTEDDVFRPHIVACIMEEMNQFLIIGKIRNTGDAFVQFAVKGPEAF